MDDTQPDARKEAIRQAIETRCKGHPDIYLMGVFSSQWKKVQDVPHDQVTVACVIGETYIPLVKAIIANLIEEDVDENNAMIDTLRKEIIVRAESVGATHSRAKHFVEFALNNFYRSMLPAVEAAQRKYDRAQAPASAGSRVKDTLAR